MKTVFKNLALSVAIVIGVLAAAIFFFYGIPFWYSTYFNKDETTCRVVFGFAYALIFATLVVYAHLAMPDEDSDDWIDTDEEVIRYCYGQVEFMWAAKIISIILQCDFRDAKKEAEKYLKELSEE